MMFKALRRLIKRNVYRSERPAPSRGNEHEED